jgi:hypothetical protein
MLSLSKHEVVEGERDVLALRQAQDEDITIE